jgi:hypothetical protein
MSPEMSRASLLDWLSRILHIGHYANAVEETALASRQTAILPAG